MMWRASALALLFARADGHGWLVNPISKNDLNYRLAGNLPAGMPSDFRYCPHCCANGNNAAGHVDTPAASCGANSNVFAQGLDVWQKWYDAAGIDVPVLTPGSDFELTAEMDADHGGQAWFMIACGSEVSESLNWTLLERSSFDHSYRFLPSTPGIYAWPVRTYTTGGRWTANYHVPASFSCPGGEAVGRWLWKTGNTCNDYNNIGRSTQTFVPSENNAIGLTNSACAPGQKPETFISCVNFRVAGGSNPGPTPGPTPVNPTPTPAPTTPAPTPPATGGRCCYGGGCSNCNGEGEWCSSAKGNCEGSCGGTYCSSRSSLARRFRLLGKASLSKVKKHE